MPGLSETTRALLLRSVDYGEADRVVTLLTERFGKRSALARHARASKRRFGGSLQALSVIEVELQRGRGDLDALRKARIARPFARLLTDLPAMSAGFAGIELLRELTAEHEPDPGLFATGVAFLEALEAGSPPASLQLTFSAAVLGLVGLAPRLDRCGQCGKQPAMTQAACFDPVEGVLVCRACGGASQRLSGGNRVRLARAAAGDFVVMAASEWPAAELNQARRVLDAFIEARLGRPLRSPQLVSSRTPSRPSRAGSALVEDS